MEGALVIFLGPRQEGWNQETQLLRVINVFMTVILSAEILLASLGMHNASYASPCLFLNSEVRAVTILFQLR